MRFPWPSGPVRWPCRSGKRTTVSRTIWSVDIDPDSRFVNRAALGRTPGPSGRSSRMDRRRRKSICSSSAKATPRRSCRSSTRTRRVWSTRSSPTSPSRAGARTSMCGRWICRQPRVASTGRTPVSSAARRCRPTTTSSTRSATCSRSTIARCVMPRRPRPTSSSKSWSTSSTYGGGGIFNDQATVAVDSAFAATFSSTSSDTTSRRWPTSTTHPMSPTRPATGASPSRGSQTSPRCRSGGAQVARSVAPGTPAADAVGEGGVRNAQPGDPGAPPRDPGAQRARNRDGCALPRGTRVGGETARRR